MSKRPIQPGLPFARPKTQGKQRGETRDAQNVEAALAVLARIESCGGEGSAMVRWARLVLARRGTA